MSIVNEKITVLNYNNFVVTMPTETRTYVLEPCEDEDNPVIVSVSISDLEYINSRSNAIRSGLILFKPEQQQEVYKTLSIFDWEDILSNKEIKNIILNPTIDGLHKIIGIRDIVTFERVRSIITSMKNTNSYDISNRVINIINSRYIELRRNIINSQIILQSKDAVSKVEVEDVENIKAQNVEMSKQLEEMKNMMAEFMKNQNKETLNTNVEVAKPEKEIETKKAGRPVKTDK